MASRAIPSLDGLRAISILLVIVGHLGGTVGWPVSEAATYNFNVANLGVRVFFVISGYLITSLLLAELRRTGSLSLPRFYFRRSLRIFPAYYAMILLVVIAGALGLTKLVANETLYAATYTSNYFLHGRAFSHAWSLAVEEQFYLLWPAVVLLLGISGAMRAACVAVVLPPLIRLGLLALPNSTFPAWQMGVGRTFETVADGLAFGCLFAGLEGRLRAKAWFHAILDHRLFLFIPISAVAVMALPGWARLYEGKAPHFWLSGFYNGFGVTWTLVAVTLVIAKYTADYEDLVGRILNAKLVSQVGIMSYSIYLWQQFFLENDVRSWYTAFPANLFCLAVASAASYYLIERPTLRLRDSWERKLFNFTAPPSSISSSPRHIRNELVTTRHDA